MNIIISNTSDEPIYHQIKEQIKDMIITKELKVGDKLPSIRMLAKDLGISVITTKNAYLELEHDGYIETTPAKGSFVANKNINLIREEELARIEKLIDNAINIANISNISYEEVKDILDILWEDNNG